jgi:hypothetical protein
MENCKAADLLIKMTVLNTHDAFSSSEVSINIVDWEAIQKGIYTKNESILVEVFRFILLDNGHVYLNDLMELTPIERESVFLALELKFRRHEYQETIN